MRFLSLLLACCLIIPVPAPATETSLSSVPVILASQEIAGDSSAVTVTNPATPVGEDPAVTAKNQLAEWRRRLKIEADKPWTCFAGALTVYRNADGQGEKVSQPAGEGFRVLDSSGTMIKVYSPYYDTVGYFNRLDTCGFRGISWDTFDWSGVNFRLGGQMVQQPKQFTFPDSLDWSHPPVTPPPATPGSSATAPTGSTPPTEPGSTSPTRRPTGPSTVTTATTPPIPPATRITESRTPPAVPGNPSRITHNEAVHVRADKALESAEVVVIPPGGPVQVLENDGSWCRVQVDGKTGFVRSKYLGL